MSTVFKDKIERLESLDERELKLLTFIMADPGVHLVDVAKEMLLGESTTRNILTSVFNKLGVPGTERDKRGFVVREYSEAYKERYLNVGKSESEPKPPPETTQRVSGRPERPPETDPEPKRAEPRPEPQRQSIPDQPTINVRPHAPRTNTTMAAGGAVGGLVFVGICAIVVLVVALVIINNLPGQQQNNANSNSPWGLHDWWDEVTIANGVTLKGGSYFDTGCGGQDTFEMSLIIFNNSGGDFSWNVNDTNFSLKDSNGNYYSIISVHFSSNNDFYTNIYSSHSDWMVTCWSGRTPYDTGASYVDLTMKNYPGMYDIIFRKSR